MILIIYMYDFNYLHVWFLLFTCMFFIIYMYEKVMVVP